METPKLNSTDKLFAAGIGVFLLIAGFVALPYNQDAGEALTAAFYGFGARVGAGP